MASIDGERIYSNTSSNTPEPYGDVTQSSEKGPQTRSSLSTTESGNGLGGRKDTQGRVEPAEEESGAARGIGEGGRTHDELQGAETVGGRGPEGEDYPEQLHAGRLDGVGPEYAAMHRVTMGDRLQGLKEEIKGTLKHDPNLKQTGKDRITGELKRREQEEANDTDPFNRAQDDESKEVDKS